MIKWIKNLFVEQPVILKEYWQPISEIKSRQVVLLACNTYDCGWCYDMGWEENGIFFISSPYGKIDTIHTQPSHFKHIVSPENTKCY